MATNGLGGGADEDAHTCPQEDTTLPKPHSHIRDAVVMALKGPRQRPLATGASPLQACGLWRN